MAIRKYILTILLSFIVLNLFGQIRKVPLAPDFLKYRSVLNNGEIDPIHENIMPGIIPAPVNPAFNISIDFKNPIREKALEEVYDLRDMGYVTSIKNQGNCGACWMFTTMASIESCWLSSGYGEYDLSEQNIKNCHGFTQPGCDGGNHLYATAYMVRGDGPVLESDDVYVISDNICQTDYKPVSYVSEARYLPPEADIVKQAIKDNGGLYTTMYYANQYLNGASNSYYYSGDEVVNHGVTLIGWDDTKNTAGGAGAWICKNSFGSNWGDNGYFYISYNDAAVLSSVAYYPERVDYSEDIILHQYDRLGWITSMGYQSEVAYALVKFKTDVNQKLLRIGTYVNSSASVLDVQIFYEKRGEVLINKLDSVGNFYCEFPGYYWIDLNQPVKFNEGENFYVRIKYKTPGYDYPLPMECFLADYSDPVIESDVCWISSSSESWEPLGSNIEGYNYDLCIKALSVADTVETVTAGKAMVYVYPNPCTDYLNIDFGLAGSKEFTLELYNTLGKRVYVKYYHSDKYNYTEHLNLSWLGAGVYIIRVSSGDKSVFLNTDRIVKINP